jgi:hypothetical protein
VAVAMLEADTKMHPKLQSKAKVIRSVILMPPTAQMTAHGIIHSDIKEKEGEQLSRAIGVLMSGLLKERGWDLSDMVSFSQAVKEKEDVKYLVDFLCARHQTFLQQLWPQDIAKGRYSLSDKVAILSKQAPVDAFVFVHADGERLTTAAVIAGSAWNIAFDSYFLQTGNLNKYDYAVLDIDRYRAFAAMFLPIEKNITLKMSLVESSTGDILSYSRLGSASPKKILNELRKIP